MKLSKKLKVVLFLNRVKSKPCKNRIRCISKPTSGLAIFNFDFKF